MGKKLLATAAHFCVIARLKNMWGGDHAEFGSQGTKVRRIVRLHVRDGKPSTPLTKAAVRFKVSGGAPTKFFDGVWRAGFSNDELRDFVLLALR